MIVETGHYALVLAFALCLVQMVVPLWGSLKGDRALMAIAAPVSIMQFVLVAISFAALTYAYLVSDFSVLNVVENSFSQKPLIYKISGVWGNHEGSMLLWVLTLALFGALVALRARRMPEDLAATALSIQSWVLGAFLLFVLLTSNPFARVGVPPMEGRDLNPLLQDPGLAIHPPLLYLGYVGLSITFSFAAAALIHGRIDAQWARWVRPWTSHRLDVPHGRHFDGFLLGLLHAGLGWLLVLGPGRERLADAVARRHRAAALRARHGEAGRAEGVDDPARDPRVLALAARRLPGALGRADLRALLRQ